VSDPELLLEKLTQDCMSPPPALAHQQLDFRRCCATELFLGFSEILKHLTCFSMFEISIGCFLGTADVRFSASKPGLWSVSLEQI